MVERAPQPRHDEQYPLLKVAGGGGDGGVHHQPPQALPGPGWGVTCAPKKSWSFRWPENCTTVQALVSLGILFLLFYPWGMEVCRRQSGLMSRCKTTKPACDVYYHHILQRGSQCPFMLYADYLANVATQYPSLCFHVFFLVDDSLVTARRSQRNPIFFDLDDRFSYSNSHSKYAFREIQHFTTKYKNMNVTIMALSDYMNMIPLNFDWRHVPFSYLTFYARIFSVWLNGGIAMDLNYFNDNYNLKRADHRISAILKQHNDGIKVAEYANVLKQINREEENEFFAVFNRLFHQIFNDTRRLFSKNLPVNQIITENGESKYKSLVRTNITKRDAYTSINDKNNRSVDISNDHVLAINSTEEKDLKKNQSLSNPDISSGKLNVTINDAFKDLHVDNSSIVNSTNKTVRLNKSEIIPKTKKSKPQVFMFYDISVKPNSIASSRGLPEPQIGKAGKFEKAVLLSIDSDGLFVAASSSLHPFLTNLMSTCCPNIQPKFTIQNTFFSYCSGIFDEDTYCNNIYVL